jgi:hypothetical protein
MEPQFARDGEVLATVADDLGTLSIHGTVMGGFCCSSIFHILLEGWDGWNQPVHGRVVVK